MIRLSLVVWVVVIALSAFGLYSVKFKVQTLRTQIARAEQQLEAERESANVVAAEWAYLNRPDRLRRLSSTYLQERAVTVDQVADVAAIPFPRVVEASVTAPAPKSPVTNASMQAEPEQGDAE